MDFELQLTVAKLRDAAELYRQLARARRDEAEGARRGRDLEALDAEYAEDQAAVTSAGEAREAAAAALEQQLRTLEEKLRRRRAVRPPDAATQLAVSQEIESLRTRRDAIEQELLELWQQDDDTETAAAAAVERDRIAARRRELAERAAKAGLARPEIETDLHHLLRKLPPRVASRLERMAGRYDDPVADLVQGSCGSCGYAMPAQVALDADREAQLVVCQGCGRYVVPRSSRRTRDQGWTS